MFYGDEVGSIKGLSYRGLGKKHALGSQSVNGENFFCEESFDGYCTISVVEIAVVVWF